MSLTTIYPNDPLFITATAGVHRKPQALYSRGARLDELLQLPRVALVGSRRMTPYGKQITQQLVQTLVAHNVVIISGLAFGIDACAHQATLTAGGTTVAVLPGPLDHIAPASHHGLARRIEAQGGGLISWYAPGSETHKGNFVARNELVAALAQAVIIPEAGQGSGSLHTAAFAASMGKQVFAVPGPLTSPLSAGTNQLLATNTAQALIDAAQILDELGIQLSKTKGQTYAGSESEQRLIAAIRAGHSDGVHILEASQLDVRSYNQALTLLEIRGIIKPLGNDFWALA